MCESFTPETLAKDLAAKDAEDEALDQMHKAESQPDALTAMLQSYMEEAFGK